MIFVRGRWGNAVLFNNVIKTSDILPILVWPISIMWAGSWRNQPFFPLLLRSHYLCDGDSVGRSTCASTGLNMWKEFSQCNMAMVVSDAVWYKEVCKAIIITTMNYKSTRCTSTLMAQSKSKAKVNNIIAVDFRHVENRGHETFLGI